MSKYDNFLLNRRIWKSIKEIATILGPKEEVNITGNSISIEFFTNMSVVKDQ